MIELGNRINYQFLIKEIVMKSVALIAASLFAVTAFAQAPAAKKEEKKADAKPAGSPKSRDEHMARRSKHLTQAEVGKEFGKHPSTVSRGVMRNGFSSGGSAKG